ncbi:LysM peptidoglycan-binding domain-containing protein, partial [Dickeya dadantii]|nr:LysM peptidoglycan-binding domain-containing protein [Dickeya dadantii]
MNLRHIAACMVIVLGVAGCSNNNSKSAPISSVDGNTGSRGGMLSAPPSRISTAGESVAATSEGRIVYNRSYGNIPKGSYSGGNAYTVKRGDTLFYIAWITGNDYRDLAQRNNIPEPYSLNVGQSLSLGSGSGNNASGGGMMSGGGMLATTDATRGGVPTPPSSAQIQTTSVDSQSTNAYSGNQG